jgi:Mrp family chromosome partitioning ATPase
MKKDNAEEQFIVTQFPSAFSDEFHGLHDSISAEAAAGRSQAIQFAGSQRGEGVTTILLGFGIFLSELYGSDQVVAVESNFREPAFRKIFRIDSDSGLQGVLLGNARLEDAIVRVRGAGLGLLPADRQGGATDVFSREASRVKLAEVLEDLKSSFRFVLVDSPPIVPFIDGCFLSSAVDGVVFVVESNKTRAEVVDQALKRLKARGANIKGLVLNKRVFHVPNFVYRFL